MEKEIWKQITGYEGLYEISNFGRVKSIARYGTVKENRIKAPLKTRGGYLRAGLSKNNIQKFIYIHRLVAQEFIPNPENKPEVNHINGIKTDNRVENLEWATSSENQLHALKIGLQKPHSKGGAKGEKNSHSFLNEKQVKEIREKYSTHKIKQTELANLYNVNISCIHSIVKFRTWKHVK